MTTGASADALATPGTAPVTIEGLDAAAVAALLHARQERHGTAPSDGVRPMAEWMVFTLGGDRMALPIGAVAAAIPMPRMTRVPGAPPVLTGIFLHAGVLCNLCDAARVLDLAATSATTMALVLRDVHSLAIAVERIDGVERVDAGLAVPDALKHFVPREAGSGFTMISLPHLVRALLDRAGRLGG